MDVAFEGAHMIWDGVLCCTADDPEAYYAADARRVLELFVLAAELELDAALPELMAALDVLAARKTPPADRQELKRVLSRLPEALDYDAAARTLALADPRWNSPPALYAALRLSREPYLPAQLAVTSAELTAAHIRGGRQAWVLRGLLDAVIAAPQINFPEALLALAKTLAGQA